MQQEGTGNGGGSISGDKSRFNRSLSDDDSAEDMDDEQIDIEYTDDC